MRRIAVIGDIGGHADVLREELELLGVDPDSGRLPSDLTVVQVGDLIHRGPDSEGVVALVDRFLRHDPDRWVQLVGNHEAQYVHTRAFHWPEELDAASVATLRRWWGEGRMRAAYAFEAEHGPTVVTHAGVTAGFWRKVLGSPGTAAETADAVNALIGGPRKDLFRPGRILHGRRADPGAGPLWASAGDELVPSWLALGRVPFSQAHGHTAVYDWHVRCYRGPRAVAACTSVDESAKHETSTLDGGIIVGVDPGHGRSPRPPWRAWVVESH